MISKGLLKLMCLGMLCVIINLGCHRHHFKSNNFINREGLIDVECIAVLPFHNLSENVNAGVIVANMIMAGLVQCGKFRVVKYGDVRNFFLQRRLTSVPTIDIETLRALREEFKVDVVIIGSVLQYDDGNENRDRKEKKGVYTPSIAVSSTILETRSGRILGKGEFTERGSAKGYLLTNKHRQDAFALVQKLAQKLIATIDTDGV